jgi:septal ring factor EnvC (AmiA/AmiB activator)
VTTVIDWLAQQPVVVAAIVAGGVAVVAAVVGVQGVFATARAADRATMQDSQEAYWTSMQAEVASLRAIHGTTEARLDKMATDLAAMQTQLWACLQEKNDLRAQMARCDERIKEVTAQFAELRREQGRRRGGAT